MTSRETVLQRDEMTDGGDLYLSSSALTQTDPLSLIRTDPSGAQQLTA
jgi:hypothetical protein